MLSRPDFTLGIYVSICLYSVFSSLKVGFSTTRIYWSMRVVGQRCRYQCVVKDVDGDPHFVVKVEEKGFEDVSFEARTPRGQSSTSINKFILTDDVPNRILVELLLLLFVVGVVRVVYYC